MISKQKLVLSCISLVLVLIIASVNVYAWFTTNSKNHVSGNDFSQKVESKVEFSLGGEGIDEFMLNPGEMSTLDIEVKNGEDTDKVISINVNDAFVTLPNTDSSFRYPKSFIDTLCYYDEFDQLFDASSYMETLDASNDFFAKFARSMTDALKMQIYLVDVSKEDTLSSLTDQYISTIGQLSDTLATLEHAKLHTLNYNITPNAQGLGDVNNGIDHEGKIVDSSSADCVAFINAQNQIVLKPHASANLFLKIYFDENAFASSLIGEELITLKNSNPYIKQHVKFNIELK